MGYNRSLSRGGWVEQHRSLSRGVGKQNRHLSRGHLQVCPGGGGGGGYDCNSCHLLNSGIVVPFKHMLFEVLNSNRMKKQKKIKLSTVRIKIRARKATDGTIYYMHRPSAVDIRFSAHSCPHAYCLDDDGIGQNSVCNNGYFGVNDYFYEYDAIAWTEALVNMMAIRW